MQYNIGLLQLYKVCVARGTCARLIFETKGGEEELSFSCRVQAGAAIHQKWPMEPQQLPEPPKSREEKASLGGKKEGLCSSRCSHCHQQQWRRS
jgi:hypothetical protein